MISPSTESPRTPAAVGRFTGLAEGGEGLQELGRLVAAGFGGLSIERGGATSSMGTDRPRRLIQRQEDADGNAHKARLFSRYL